MEIYYMEIYIYVYMYVYFHLIFSFPLTPLYCWSLRVVILLTSGRIGVRIGKGGSELLRADISPSPLPSDSSVFGVLSFN